MPCGETRVLKCNEGFSAGDQVLCVAGDLIRLEELYMTRGQHCYQFSHRHS